MAILFSALFATSLLAYAFPAPLDADYSMSLAFGLLWASFSVINTLFLAQSYLLEVKRRDFRNAYFLGSELNEEEIRLPSLHHIRNNDVRRSIAAGTFTSLACQFAGASLALLTTAVMIPAYSSYFLATSALMVASAAGVYIYGHAPRVRAQDSTVWPWPNPSDFRTEA